LLLDLADMTEYWQDLRLKGADASGEMTAEASFGPDSLWFSGHFPGYPIVPGVALIRLVTETLRRLEGEGGRLAVRSVRRVRFRQPVRPGGELTVIVSAERPGEEGLHHFRILSGGETVCTGAVLATRPAPGEEP